MIQTYGILTDLHDDVIVLTRNDGSTFGLPPDPTLLEAAGPGVYTVRGRTSRSRTRTTSSD